MQIYDGRACFYQWDLNQKIKSATFKVGDEIHFANVWQKEAHVVRAYEYEGEIVADVPNILLQDAYPITAYCYVKAGESGQTIKEFRFPVKERPKPDDYIYTETEILTVEKVVEAALQEAIKNGEIGGNGGVGIQSIEQTTTSTEDGGENVITATLTDGTKSTFIVRNGSKGAAGYTPVRGTDYWNEADKANIKAYVNEAILGGAW